MRLWFHKRYNVPNFRGFLKASCRQNRWASHFHRSTCLLYTSNSLQYDPYYQLYAEQFPDTQLGQLFATGNYFEDWQPNFIETYQPYYAESIPTFYFTEDDLDRINTLQTPLDDYVASMEAKFITGEISIEDEYDNFVATLEEYGVQEYVELYNSYYGG